MATCLYHQRRTAKVTVGHGGKATHSRSPTMLCIPLILLLRIWLIYAITPKSINYMATH